MSIENFYTETLTSQRATDTVDASRSPISTYSNYEENIKACVQPKTGTSEELAGRPVGTQVYIVYMDTSHDVEVFDYLWYRGKRLQVIQPPANVGSLNQHLRIVCVESDP